jgi:hypothetical protein
VPETYINVPPDHASLATHRAQVAALLASALDHVERAAVCAQQALDAGQHGQIDDGPRLSIEAVLSSLRQQREVLIDEQAAMVEAYADSLRRAGGQA